VVWEREGRVYWFENNPATATKTLILDVSSVCQGWDDSGLLGLAFHPSFETNRYVFLWYNHTRPGVAVVGNANTRPASGQDTINRLSRFTLDANGVAIPGTETVFIEQNDTSVWHNGGGMFFHPQNGFLYITNGDDTVGSHTQRIDLSLFSGVLRIDVDKRGGAISHAPPKRAANEVSANWPMYYVPNDNPFVGVANALEEFFAIGLRSPHRMTVDPATGRIFIGDVGAGTREEVSVIEPNDPPGLNLQWDRIEGYGGDLTGTYVGVNKRPLIDYGRTDGAAVIGGYVYRGTAFPELVGKYIFGDNISNRIWILDESTHTATTPASKILIATLPKGTGPNSGNDYVGLSSFGYDANNELYMCQLSSPRRKDLQASARRSGARHAASHQTLRCWRLHQSRESSSEPEADSVCAELTVLVGQRDQDSLGDDSQRHNRGICPDGGLDVPGGFGGGETLRARRG
jgi:glucose/arabinose dehydrogenase